LENTKGTIKNGQSRELARLGTQDTRRRQTKQNKRTQYVLDTKIEHWQFLNVVRDDSHTDDAVFW